MSETDKLKVKMYDEVVKEKNKEYIELTCRFRETCSDIKNKDKEIERLKEDNEYLNKVNIELSTEKNRLNNIINKALEKSKGLQYRYGYVLDDLVYLLMQGSDK